MKLNLNVESKNKEYRIGNHLVLSLLVMCSTVSSTALAEMADLQMKDVGQSISSSTSSLGDVSVFEMRIPRGLRMKAGPSVDYVTDSLGNFLAYGIGISGLKPIQIGSANFEVGLEFDYQLSLLGEGSMIRLKDDAGKSTYVALNQTLHKFDLTPKVNWRLLNGSLHPLFGFGVGPSIVMVNSSASLAGSSGDASKSSETSVKTFVKIYSDAGIELDVGSKQAIQFGGRFGLVGSSLLIASVASYRFDF